MGEELVIGLDLGGTKLAAALFKKNAAGALEFSRALENRKYDVIFGGAKKLKHSEKSERIEAAMASAVKELAAGAQVSAIGVCSAGFVENGVIAESYNTGMKNTPLRDNVQKRTGAPTFLYKDAWAPVYALRPPKPAIIFSIGTGFGGVSCEPDLSIRLRSYTVSKKPIWVPFLYANDDPGYAVTFSTGLSAKLIFRALERANAGPLKNHPVQVSPGDASEWASLLRDKAKKEKRLSPSPVELRIAKLFARVAAERMPPGEVFADVPGAAAFAPFVYSWLTCGNIAPPELDKRLASSDPNAIAAFFVQAEFIGHILYIMQKERVEAGLPPAEMIFATGSGYNTTTHSVLSAPIAEAMNEYCAANGIAACPASRVEFLSVPGDAPTTLACLGAAMGASMGVT
ncbi:MAG: ROK family protein [bacterium]